MLNIHDINILKKKLPIFELSYDNIIHKKVFEKIDYYMLVPNGIKSLLWFTHYKNNYISILIKINKYNQYEDFKIATICYNEELAENDTIFLGYEFNIKNKTNLFFTISDIIYYKGEYLNKITYKEKILLFEKIFKNDIKQIYLTNNSLIVGLPLICYNIKDIEYYKNIIAYNLGGIFYIAKNNYQAIGISYYNINVPIYAVFKISANIQPDIYNMEIIDNNFKSIFYDILLIDSFKTSVMMNNLFRNIKENKNLDLLEESDSEDEFENVNEDKYVNLKKILNIKCKYNNKLKKWIPIEISKEKPILKKDLISLLKK